MVDSDDPHPTEDLHAVRTHTLAPPPLTLDTPFAVQSFNTQRSGGAGEGTASQPAERSESPRWFVGGEVCTGPPGCAVAVAVLIDAFVILFCHAIV